MEVPVSYEDLKKAAFIAEGLYYAEKPLFFQGRYITELRLLDQDRKEVRFFDPTEEDGVSQTMHGGIQPQFCEFQVNTVPHIDDWHRFHDGKESEEASWSSISLKQLHELWANCL